MSPEAITTTTFVVRRRGYDRDEVEAFLRTVAAQHRAVLEDLHEAQRRVATVGNTPGDADERLGDDVVHVLRAARDEARRMVEEAESERLALREQARREVEELLAAGMERYQRLQAIHVALSDQLAAAEQGVRSLRQEFDASVAADADPSVPPPELASHRAPPEANPG